jgi:predicted DNA-binding protein
MIGMAILTVRLTEEEERLLTRRSRRAGMKKASFVRKLIREQPLETAADVLTDALKRMGDERLSVARR